MVVTRIIEQDPTKAIWPSALKIVPRALKPNSLHGANCGVTDDKVGIMATFVYQCCDENPGAIKC